MIVISNHGRAQWMSVLFRHRSDYLHEMVAMGAACRCKRQAAAKCIPRLAAGETILHSLQVDVCWLLRLLDDFAPSEQQQDELRICIYFESLNLLIPLPGSGFALRAMALLRH